ncbi:MAG: PKD domain-containing protein, partial [Salibacteraceae bacterium]
GITRTFNAGCTEYPLSWVYDGDTLSTDSFFTMSFSNIGLHEVILASTDGFCEDLDTVRVHYLPDSTCLGTDSISKISSTSGNFNGVLGNGDLFGMGVTSYPDVNNDQKDEIIVGAPRNAAGGTERGALFVLHVDNQGLIYDHYKIGSDSGNLGTGINNGDNFGFSVDKIGDVNGDGIEDLAVGAPYDDDGGTSRGAVWILFMDSNGLVDSKQKISDTQGGLQESLTNTDRFGLEVAGIGDLNNDGVPDIACGLTTDFVNSTNDGSVLILFLNANGTVNSEIKLDINSSGLSSILSPGSAFGQAIEYLGDFNSDGIKDYALGFGQHDGGGIDRGAFAIVSLDSTGAVTQANRIAEYENGFNHALPNSGNFGSALANLGDVDGDGYLEIGVGNWRDNTGGTERGALWILSIDNSGYVFNTVKLDGNNSYLNLSNGDRFGRSIATMGDFNNDGVTDLIVGAREDDDGGSNRGAIYLVSLIDTCCPLVAQFTTTSTDVCLGESLTFTNNSFYASAGASYQWLINGTVVDSTTNLTHTFNTAGSYFVELVVNDSCERSF